MKGLHLCKGHLDEWLYGDQIYRLRDGRIVIKFVTWSVVRKIHEVCY